MSLVIFLLFFGKGGIEAEIFTKIQLYRDRNGTISIFFLDKAKKIW